MTWPPALTPCTEQGEGQRDTVLNWVEWEGAQALPPSTGNKGRKEGKTLTLHYLCLAVLAQADVASHCVFKMRSGSEPGGR